jgi:hypothetical protein
VVGGGCVSERAGTSGQPSWMGDSGDSPARQHSKFSAMHSFTLQMHCCSLTRMQLWVRCAAGYTGEKEFGA